MTNIYKLHPWHGVEKGEEAPELVTAFIEIIPSDTVKYEIDKQSGYLKVDRPQKFSNIVPALYGFIPQTYCAEALANVNMKHTGRVGIKGDGDPLDILVLTEREITHGDILVRAIPIGGFRLVDNNEADDKIIAVLKNDDVYGQWKDISDVPTPIINRLKHYFLTYKQMPDKKPTCIIDEVYGRSASYEVIQASAVDYENHYGKNSAHNK
ncbi:MAG: inorganic pyrophosphatase [Saprospiraceae bacterium]|nr:inorganic pyrophosphatase [Saprospiraceae bacterium]